MPPSSRHRRPSDESQIANIARSKIYREFRRADPNLRLCVGHANMLDNLNAAALEAATQAKRGRKQRPSNTRNGPDSRIQEISQDYLNLKPQAIHVENVSITEKQYKVSVSNQFSIVGTEDSDEDSDESPGSSPPSSPPAVMISVSSVEVDDNDDCDDFDLPLQRTKHSRHGTIEYGHAPPLLTALVEEKERVAPGMLGTITVSEELCNSEWDED